MRERTEMYTSLGLPFICICVVLSLRSMVWRCVKLEVLDVTNSGGFT